RRAPGGWSCSLVCGGSSTGGLFVDKTTQLFLPIGEPNIHRLSIPRVGRAWDESGPGWRGLIPMVTWRTWYVFSCRGGALGQRGTGARSRGSGRPGTGVGRVGGGVLVCAVSA